MPVVSSTFVNSLRYETVYNVPKKEYDAWSERIISQLLSKVEVAGYRPGKAPREKLLANVNMDRVNRVVFEETIDKFAKEAIDEANAKIKEDNPDHFVLSHNIDEADSKIDDDGFTFKLVTSLLPLVNISPLDDLQIEQPSDTDLGIISFEEFEKQETGKFLYYFNEYEKTESEVKQASRLKANLKGFIGGEEVSELGGEDQEISLGFGRYLPEFEKNMQGHKAGDKFKFKMDFPDDYFVAMVRGKEAEFEVELLEVEQAKYSGIEELINHNSHGISAQIPDMEAFRIHLEKSYASMHQQTSSTKLRETVIKKLLEVIPAFDLPSEDVDKEFSRINENTKQIAEVNKITKLQVLEANGIPFEGEPKTDEEIEKALRDYVVNEFKLSTILNFVYLKKVPQEQKITKEQLAEIANAMKNAPQEYGLEAGITDEKAQREANERAVRNIALSWIMDKVVVNK
ncbi:MAG: hypothetical protein OHK0017_09920 [Patescibacteria group bacterium]